MHELLLTLRYLENISNICKQILLWIFFQRRKKSTREVLEKIRDQISDIEEFNQSTQVWHKKLIGYLLAYFSVLYLIGALVAYLKFFNKPGWRDFTSQIQLLAPFIVAPFMWVKSKQVKCNIDITIEFSWKGLVVFYAYH